jgi:LexA-binding, inner membrane-associated putative hydrolase
MDFITHTLMGAGACRLIVRDRTLLPQVTLAAVLGSLIQDGDSWLYLIGSHYYGLYHRVASHSWIGLLACGIAAACLAWLVTCVPKWRRFGWFVSSNLPKAEEIAPHPPLRLFITAALIAAYLHWCADVITGFGNMLPLWPWSRWDASLRIVFSFDLIIFTTTLGWHIAVRRLDWPRRKEAVIAAGYLVLMAVYLTARWKSGVITFI